MKRKYSGWRCFAVWSVPGFALTGLTLDINPAGCTYTAQGTVLADQITKRLIWRRPPRRAARRAHHRGHHRGQQ